MKMNQAYIDALPRDIDNAIVEDFNVNLLEGMFVLKTANQWIEEAKSRPIPKMLFGEFWFEGEICILFSDTNLGKSILAVQIGNSISKGEAISGLKLESDKQKILYFDFELSDKQFENRYSNDYSDHYVFDSNFVRVEINQEMSIPDNLDFETYLINSLEQSILRSNSKVLILDNITYLKSGTETAKDALPLMKHLKALKSKYGLSILVLAHTPKRDLSKPITNNDLAGSKMLINFCDSSFTIGESSSDKNLRYVKQIKQRNTEQIYDAENVCVCQIIKTTNYLEFELIGHGTEREHLKQSTESDRGLLIESVKELHSQGKTQREISKELSISLGVVNKYIRIEM